MQLPLGTVLVIVAVLASAVLVIDREHRRAPLLALAAAVVQAVMLFGALDWLRGWWHIELVLPATQFVAAYSVWTDTQKKRAVTASTLVLAVTLLELALLLGRVRP